MMKMIWDDYKDFSSEFLAHHHHYVLYDTFNHIKAFLLYPLNCSCSDCQCESARNKIVLSLTMDLFNRAQECHASPEQLHAMKMLFKIPDDTFFKANYAQSYPVWLIEEKFCQEDLKKNFKIIEHLVWGLLRLAKTYEVSAFKESRASINEAVEMILGNTPLKTTAKKLEKVSYLCGEKAYGAQLTIYKSVCHFIAAYKYMEGDNPSFALTQPEQIQQFLNLSHWFRKKLLPLETPNVKQRSLFPDNALITLPEWINSEDIHISIDPFPDKLQKLNTPVRRVI